MPIRTTVITRRPDQSAEFFNLEPSARQYFLDTYETSGLMTRSVTLSPDQLEQTVVREFVDEAAFRKYQTDDASQRAKLAREIYNEPLGHVTTFKLEHV